MRDHTYRANLLKRFGKDNGETVSPVRVLIPGLNRREQEALNSLIESGEVSVTVSLSEMGVRSLRSIQPMKKILQTEKVRRPKINLDALPDSVSDDPFKGCQSVDPLKIIEEAARAMALFKDSMKDS